MAIRRVLQMGHPLLRAVARPLECKEPGSEPVKRLITDMVDTLHDYGGIGLAAPQIGESVRLAIIEIPGGPSRYGVVPPLPLTVFVNPVIDALDERVAGCWEGCLSVPGLRGWVERPQHVGVRALDLDGKPFELELEGCLATGFQHECGRLDGRLYVDLVRDPRRLVFEDLLEVHLAGESAGSAAAAPAAPG